MKDEYSSVAKYKTLEEHELHGSTYIWIFSIVNTEVLHYSLRLVESLDAEEPGIKIGLTINYTWMTAALLKDQLYMQHQITSSV